MELQIESAAVGNATILTVTGEVDVATAPQLDEQLAVAATAPKIVLDLTAVTFLDSSGLGVIIKGLKRVSELGGSLVLVVTNPSILKVFSITGLDKVLMIVDTTDAALA